ncbi:MAG: hypothetical protein R3C11_07245 [Planctomycetaceae bacterium]
MLLFSLPQLEWNCSGWRRSRPSFNTLSRKIAFVQNGRHLVTSIPEKFNALIAVDEGEGSGTTGPTTLGNS